MFCFPPGSPWFIFQSWKMPQYFLLLIQRQFSNKCLWFLNKLFLKNHPDTQIIAEVRVTILDKAFFKRKLFLKERGALDWEKSRGFTSSHVRLIYLGWYWVLCPCLFSLQELDPSEKALILWYPCGNMTRVLFQFVFYFKQEELQISWGLFPYDLFVYSSSEQS